MLNYEGKSYTRICIPNPVGSGMLMLYAGESGYDQPSDPDHPEWAWGYDKDDEFMSTPHIPEPVKRAFLHGSMFGWDVPAADPNHEFNQAEGSEDIF